jgi:hypothetical protein
MGNLYRRPDNVINKTIKLTGEYPSDFKPDMIVEGIQQYFESHSLYVARMLDGSKWQYHEKYPDDLIVWNANVLIPDYGKVWYGDLNLTKDYILLKSIADALDNTLYVLWETDGRFGEENKPIDELIKKSMWNTTDDKPNKEWYKKKMEKRYNK